MISFYSAGREKRPVRLSERTRQLAQDALNGIPGDAIHAAGSVHMDDIPGFADLPAYEKYDLAVERIVREAPICLREGEELLGSASFGDAVTHRVPAKFRGEPIFFSISHLTLDFPRVLREGVSAIEKQVAERREETGLSAEESRFLESCTRTLQAMHLWHERWMQKARRERPEAAERLEHVPFAPPRTFAEAVQSLWFTFAFVRLLGNWPGIGRIDAMLGPLLERDLAEGKITRQEARELLAQFFIKGCEWIYTDCPRGSGDAQHYQNLVLAGVDENGRDITNAVTYLVLEVVEELPIGDYPITVRLNSQTPQPLKELIARVIRHGGGVVAVYCEDTILAAFRRLGYPEQEARQFANDGCWEVQVPGKTRFGYIPFDGLGVLLSDTMHLEEQTPPQFASFEELYTAFRAALQAAVGRILNPLLDEYTARRAGAYIGGYCMPCTAVSLFEEGCIASGRSYADYGSRYKVLSPHIGGAADIANSLYAIRTAVFEEKRLRYDELVSCLQDNWASNEAMRLFLHNRLTYFGNDTEGPDVLYARVLQDFADAVDAFDGRTEIRCTAGVSTFGRQVDWKDIRWATPFGSRRGDILASNASPTPGTDISGATAMLHSVCRPDLSRMGTGAAVDLKLHPSVTDGQEGIAAICALLDGFCALRGSFLQIDVVDAAVLRDAQKHPENYRSLSVRVSGWNARFVTLNEDWQRMIIEKTEQTI